jgi:hypothetical protein
MLKYRQKGKYKGVTMRIFSVLTWINPFKKGGPFSGPRKCDGEQADPDNSPPARHHPEFPTVAEIHDPTTVGEGDHPPIFAPTKP